MSKAAAETLQIVLNW